jgi:putative endonuclease
MRRNQALGKYGEDIAAQHLLELGMAIVARNWRCNVGEIDIVARDGHTLVICEVKTRSSHDLGTPAEAITPRKLRRLRTLAFRYLNDQQMYFPLVRIDLVSVVQPAWGAPEVDHLKDLS